MFEFLLAQARCLLSGATTGRSLLDHTALVWGFEILSVGLGWGAFRALASRYEDKDRRNIAERRR
jgi:hypothetical protein